VGEQAGVGEAVRGGGRWSSGRRRSNYSMGGPWWRQQLGGGMPVALRSSGTALEPLDQRSSVLGAADDCVMRPSERDDGDRCSPLARAGHTYTASLYSKGLPETPHPIPLVCR
jgi:hypothetical protein